MTLLDSIQNILVSYRPLSLEQAEAVRLMRRTDTKYIVPLVTTLRLLQDLKKDYHVLEIASHRIGTYTSTYYDTSDRKMFHAHVTGRFPRYKVRERTYSQNGLKFFEVKQKCNKGRTVKRRMSITENSSEANDWLPEQIPFRIVELSPILINSFERLTLINNEQTERVTLDFNLFFRTLSGVVTPVFDRTVIIELKQDKTALSPLRNYLRHNGARPNGISKFCTGLLLTGIETGYKRYKPKFSQFIKAQHE